MENISKEEALEMINEYATLLTDYYKTATIFCVGSLAEDDYKENRSDIDVAVVTKNDEELKKVEDISKEIIKLIKSKHKTDIEFEAYVKPEKEVLPPYEFGKNQTIEAMRLKKQAKLIKGEFNPEIIPIPSREDFLKDAITRDEAMVEEKGEHFIDDLNNKKIINLILEYLRLELITDFEHMQFNKTKIIEESLERSLIDSKTCSILKKIRNNEPLTEDEIIFSKKIAEKKRNQFVNTYKVLKKLI